MNLVTQRRMQTIKKFPVLHQSHTNDGFSRQFCRLRVLAGNRAARDEKFFRCFNEICCNHSCLLSLLSKMMFLLTVCY